jgi:mono/diheme cytochrome c family protein
MRSRQLSHSVAMTRAASACLIALWAAGCPVRAQENNPAADNPAAINAGADNVAADDVAAEVRKGHHLATLLCTSCHVAASDQLYAPTADPPAPSFAAIAQRPDVTADSLQRFLTTTRDGLENPKGMPNPGLVDFQKQAIAAYILSLRQARPNPAN